MMANPNVVGYTKTLNHQKILEKRKKTTENQSNTEPNCKLSEGPSFTFTVACRREQFTPPAAAGGPKHIENYHWQFAGSEKILEIPSFDKTFSGVPSKNNSFTTAFYWNSINASWIWAVSTLVVSSCWSSAPPPSSVNDGSLPKM